MILRWLKQKKREIFKNKKYIEFLFIERKQKFGNQESGEQQSTHTKKKKKRKGKRKEAGRSHTPRVFDKQKLLTRETAVQNYQHTCTHSHVPRAPISHLILSFCRTPHVIQTPHECISREIHALTDFVSIENSPPLPLILTSRYFFFF